MISSENELINERLNKLENEGLSEELNERLNELSLNERSILDYIYNQPEITQEKLAENLKLSEQYVRKLIKNLKDKQILQRVGSKKSGHWEVLK